jgi:hypothetical protein
VIAVTSASTSLLTSISPTVETVAELVTLGNADGATATVSAKLALSPAAIEPA